MLLKNIFGFLFWCPLWKCNGIDAPCMYTACKPMPHVLNSNMFLKNGLKEETETGYHNEVCYYKNGVILRRWGHCSFLYIIPPILCAYLQSIAGDCFVSRPFYLLLSPPHAFSLSCSWQHSGDLRVKRSREGVWGLWGAQSGVSQALVLLLAVSLFFCLRPEVSFQCFSSFSFLPWALEGCLLSSLSNGHS